MTNPTPARPETEEDVPPEVLDAYRDAGVELHQAAVIAATAYERMAAIENGFARTDEMMGTLVVTEAGALVTSAVMNVYNRRVALVER